MEGGEIKHLVQKGTPSYQDKIKKWTGRKYLPSRKLGRLMNILILYHIRIEFVLRRFPFMFQTKGVADRVECIGKGQNLCLVSFIQGRRFYSPGIR